MKRKKNGFPIWIMIVANLLLLGVCGFGFARLDMQAPVIKFPEETPVYRDGMTDEELLSGVTAYDNLDKDVTKRLVVEKVSEDPSGEKVIVYYAVSDRRGNAARVSREIPAEGLKKWKDTEVMLASAPTSAPEMIKEETVDPEADEADEISEDSEEPEEAVSPEKTAAPANAAAPAPAPAAAAPAVNPAPVQVPAADPAPAVNPAPAEAQAADPAVEAAQAAAAQAAAEQEAARIAAEQAAAQAAVEQQAALDAQAQAQAVAAAQTAAAEAEEKSGSQPPVLTLNSSTVTVPVGTKPAWVNVIGQMTDDKDGYNTLFKNLSIGSYDINKPGTYTVNVQTKDSDGNPSASCPLTIVVQ